MTVYQVCLHLSSSNTQPKQVVNGDGRGSRATGVPALVGKKRSPWFALCLTNNHGLGYRNKLRNMLPTSGRETLWTAWKNREEVAAQERSTTLDDMRWVRYGTCDHIWMHTGTDFFQKWTQWGFFPREILQWSQKETAMSQSALQIGTEAAYPNVQGHS